MTLGDPFWLVLAIPLAMALWRWRLPAQGRDEPPGLNIFLWKLPGGALVAAQIRLTSPLFALTDKISPGCLMKDALLAAGYMEKLDTIKRRDVDVYGALPAGVLIEGRQSDSTCTAITIIPSPVDVPWDIAPGHPQTFKSTK